MFYEVIPTEVYRAGGGVLTYSSDFPLQPGHIVLIPLGKKVITGIVSKKVPKVDFPTKPIVKLLHPYPLPTHLLKSIFWLSKYYLSPLPAAANLMLPAGLTARGAIKDPTAPANTAKTAALRLAQNPTSQAQNPTKTPQNSKNPAKFPSVPLNQAQQNALQALQEAPGATRLLRGVTGSGKTNIYLKMAENALEQQKSTILLVPEIALTSQLVQIFEQTFAGRVVLIHSSQTLAERRKTWLNILNSTYNGVEQKNLNCWSETIRSATSEKKAARARDDGTRELRVCENVCENIDTEPEEPLLFRKLRIIQLRVESALRQQFIMLPLLDNRPVAHHQNQIRISNRR